ncbi:DUF2125 domain-containing protein [Rhizobium sp. BK251]|uniref:DUF2125 domain-containing protein n=1 Tax=Rhizobium sp. BK251 TaxID=2512125 RepID=UPI00104FE278|nr:DUF2125 domain-containing protein [Rhizobium sp. BK251]TCL72680.1 hypothetical protein EV286_104103 [Rhizobium sp. BK251]
MAASSQGSYSGVSKKIWLLGLAIVLVIGGYTAGWFYAASLLKDSVLKALGKQDTAAITGQCSDIAFRGFPFRIGLFCSSVQIDDHRNGVSASFGNLRSAAQVYAPGHIVWELDSPAEIRTAHGLTVSAEWSNLQSSLVTRLTGVERTSTVIENLKATIVSAFTNQTFNVDAARTEIHLRQNEGNLDAAVTVENSNTVVKDFPQVFPALTASADATLTGKAGLIDGSDDGKGLYGSKGALHKVVADIGEGRIITLSGPFSFDDSGYLSGQFRLEIQQLDPWRDSLKQVFPGLAPTIDMAGKLLKALAAGGDKVSVDLRVDRGQISLNGFIPLGSLPPI